LGSLLFRPGRKGKQLTGSLPGGWKQRVALGAAIMHEPSVLFLMNRHRALIRWRGGLSWTIINRLADLGSAILVTTHYLEEAEQCIGSDSWLRVSLSRRGHPAKSKIGRRATCWNSWSISRSALRTC